MSDAAEQALSLVESHAAAAWREVAAGVWPLPDEHPGSMAASVVLQLLRETSVRDSMSVLASHALLLEVILGGWTRLREALIAAEEPIDHYTVTGGWVELLGRASLSTALRRLEPGVDADGSGAGDRECDGHPRAADTPPLAGHVPAATVPAELAALGASLAGGHRRGALHQLAHGERRTAPAGFLFHYPDDASLAGFDLPHPREREVAVNAQLLGWIAEDDRQVLIVAGFGPTTSPALPER